MKNLEIAPGEKKHFDLKVPGTDFSFPVTIIKGKKEGPFGLVQAGLHNAEYPGIQAAIELRKELEPEDITGTLMIIPLLNTSGFRNRTFSLVAEDQKNINRSFPGNPDGSLTDQLCYFLQEEIYPKLDFFIDLHSGDAYEKLNEFTFIQGNADEKTKAISEEMGKHTDTPFLVASKSNTGGAFNYAGKLGVPAILIERGCGGIWTPGEVEKDKKDVKNLLRYFGMLTGEAEATLNQKVYINPTYEVSDVSGCWYPALDVGDSFKKGDLLGEIRDLFGEPIKKVEAQMDGTVIYQTTSLNLNENDPIIAYVEKQS